MTKQMVTRKLKTRLIGIAVTLLLCIAVTSVCVAQHTGIAVDTPLATLHVSGMVRADSLAIPSAHQGNLFLSTDTSGNARWASIVNSSLPQLHRTGDEFLPGESYGVEVRGHLAYVTDVTSGSLHIYDIDQPDPHLVSSTYVGPFPYDLEVTGNYAIILETIEDSIIVMDISNPAMPVRRGTAFTAGAFWCEVSGNTILVAGQVPSVMISLDYSNPDLIIPLDTLQLPNYANQLEVYGSTAFVANLFEDQVYVIDVAMPGDMALEQTVFINSPRILHAVDNVLYIAASSNLYQYDITDIQMPVLIAQTAAGNFACGNVTDVELIGNILLWATEDGCILWYDVLSSDTIASLGLLDYVVGGQHLDHEGGVVVRTNGTTLRRYDIQESILGAGLSGNPVAAGLVFNGSVEVRSGSLFDHFDLWNTQIAQRTSLTVTDSLGFLIADDSVGVFSISGETGNVGINTLPGDSKVTSSFRVETIEGGLRFPDGTLQTTKIRDDLWYREGNDDTNTFDNYAGTSDSQPFQIGTNGTGRFFFTPGKKVGLGTANPASTFTVSGPDDPFDGPIITLMGETFDQVTSGEIRMRMTVNNQAASYIHYDGSANRLHFGVNPGYFLSGDDDINAFSVHRNTGYVGIGTPNPEHPLHVESDQVSGQSITLVLGSSVSDRPVLLFSEVDSNLTFSAGMSIEYDHTGMQTHFNSVGGSPAMTIESSGNVGIGLTDPTALLEVNASTVIKQTAGNWTATSDIRMKQDIRDFTDGLETVLRIGPIRYRYNDLSGYDTREEHVGVIAQELQDIAPYMVGTFEKDGVEYLEVDNSAIMYLLINSVKELADQQDAIQAELDTIRLALKAER
jgi:hypothetical protein